MGVSADIEDVEEKEARRTVGEAADESSPRPPKPKRKRRLTRTQRLQQELEVAKDQALRTAAEFANYRRRLEREMELVVQRANMRLIEAMLPVLDDLERSVDSLEDKTDVAAVGKGLEMVHAKFLDVLAKQGLEPIAAVGDTFDPDKHHALMTRKSESHEPNVILEEYEKGYTLHGVVLRPSKVVVSE